MTTIDSNGYISRRTIRNVWRNWWLIKHQGKKGGSFLSLKTYIPDMYIGKKIRFKVEVIE